VNPAPSGVRRTRNQGTFAVIGTGVLAYSLLQSLVLPVLPTIQASLHTSQTAATWVLTAYLLSASIFTPITGRLGDIAGKKRVFVTALLAMALGSLLAALAPNVGVMIIGRVVQGIGGGVLPLAISIVRENFPPDRVSGPIGAIATLGAAGAGLGAVLAGPVVTALGFRWLFWLPMLMTAAAALAAHLLVPASSVRAPGHISWLPAILLSGWLVALLVALSQSASWGWGSGQVIGLLIAAIAVALLWVLVERRAAMPLIDMAMMRRPAVWTSNLVSLLCGAGLFGVFAFVPQLVQAPRSTSYGFGASITQAGLILLPLSVAMFLLGMLSGSLARRIGDRLVVLLGCLASIAGMVLLTLAHGAQWELYPATAVMGLGFGMTFGAVPSLIVKTVSAEQTGAATGMNANIRTIGGSIGVALTASVVTATRHMGGLPTASGYTHAFAMLAIALAIAATAALLIPSAGPRRPGSSDGIPAGRLAAPVSPTSAQGDIRS
jgi:EmrB/QacA subfamily drug resistance transporter